MTDPVDKWPWWKVAAAVIGFIVLSLYAGWQMLVALANGALR